MSNESREPKTMLFILTSEYYPGEHEGYRPVFLIEGKRGYRKNGGGEVEPWYFGHEYTDAVDICHKKNRAMGISVRDENAIIKYAFEQHVWVVRPKIELKEAIDEQEKSQ